MKKLLYTNHPETKERYEQAQRAMWSLYVEIILLTWLVGLCLALIAWLS